MKRNKKYLIAFILILSLSFFCEEISAEKISDGPYIFWQENKAIIKYAFESEVFSKEITFQDTEQIKFTIDEFEQSYLISPQPPKIEPSIFKDVARIFILSDVHGQYDRFVQILKANHVIDEELNWQWGDGHLVVLGDVLDRGPEVTEALWLIHQLEKQAEEKGGKVHFSLGNHEMMVLQKDTRYVHEKYKKTAEEYFQISITELFGKDTEFGRWLRTKNTIFKINDILFVHAGIYPTLPEMEFSLEMINKVIRENLDSPREILKSNDDLNFLFGSFGPFWYRGYFYDYKDLPILSEPEFEKILQEFEASEMVVGHTTFDNIRTFYHDRLFAVDSGIKYATEGEALVWIDGIFYRATAEGEWEILKNK